MLRLVVRLLPDLFPPASARTIAACSPSGTTSSPRSWPACAAPGPENPPTPTQLDADYETLRKDMHYLFLDLGAIPVAA